MYGNKGRKRDNPRERYNESVHLKKHKKERNNFDKYRGREEEKSHLTNRARLFNRGNSNSTFSKASENSQKNISNLEENYVCIGPSDDVYDAAYLDENNTASTEKEQYFLPPHMDVNKLEFGSTNEKTLYNKSYQGSFAKIVDHCKSSQPIVYTSNCCLYPPDETSIDFSQSVVNHGHGSCTILVSNLPNFVDEAMLKDIFSQCGKIEFVCLHTQNENNQQERTESCYRIKFWERDSAVIAVQYNNHFLLAGAPESIMLPELLSKIQVDFAVEFKEVFPPLLEKDPAFSECNVSRIISLLRKKEQFRESSQIIVNWLMAGECTNYTVDIFLELIANVNGFVPCIIDAYEDLKFVRDKYREELLQKALSIRENCNAMKAVLATSNILKVWRVFHPDQRSMIQQSKDDFEKEASIIEINLEDITASFENKSSLLKNNRIWSPEPSNTEAEENHAVRAADNSTIASLKEENMNLISQLVHMKRVLDETSDKVIQLHKELKNKEQYERELLQNQKDKQSQIYHLESQLEALKQLVVYESMAEQQKYSDDHKATIGCNVPLHDMNCSEDGGHNADPLDSEIKSLSSGAPGQTHNGIDDWHENVCAKKTEFEKRSANANSTSIGNLSLNLDKAKQSNRKNRSYRSNQKLQEFCQDKAYLKQPGVTDKEISDSITKDIKTPEEYPDSGVKIYFKENKKSSGHLSGCVQKDEDMKTELNANLSSSPIWNTTTPVDNNDYQCASSQDCNDVLKLHEDASLQQYELKLREIALISVISIALHSYLKGATTEDLLRYCISNQLEVTKLSMKALFNKCSDIFQCAFDDNGSERWVFIGFDILSSNCSIQNSAEVKRIER